MFAFVCVRGGHFNSQPHKEADGVYYVSGDWVLEISTHSLTRRLTYRFGSTGFSESISTHSLTRRLTI